MKVGVVHPNALERERIRWMVERSAQAEVAWLAAGADQAVAASVQAPADVVIAGVPAVEADPGLIGRLRALGGLPVLVVTVSLGDQRGLVFGAIRQGAADSAEIPSTGLGLEDARVDLLHDKLLRLAGEISGARALGPRPAAGRARGGPPVPHATWPPLVAIGCSAGGPTALVAILSQLSADLPAGIVIAQHIGGQFTGSLVDWLAGLSNLPVVEARSGMAVSPGQVVLPAGDRHISVTAEGRLRLSKDPIDALYWPSVDVLFHSVAQHWAGRGLGVILTGMGRDGAEGLHAMHTAGFQTLGQDAATSTVDGMPRAAAEAGAVDRRLGLPHIAGAIEAWARGAARG